MRWYRSGNSRDKSQNGSTVFDLRLQDRHVTCGFGLQTLIFTDNSLSGLVLNAFIQSIQSGTSKPVVPKHPKIESLLKGDDSSWVCLKD